MKNLIILLFTVASVICNAQSIEGEWETFNDGTNEKKSVVRIYKRGDKYFGEIIKLFVTTDSPNCTKCEGDKKDKPLIGLVIIENISKDDDEYNGGTITDPKSGEVYSCYLELVNDDKLKVRGYIGFSLLGRTQYWKRVKS